MTRKGLGSKEGRSRADDREPRSGLTCYPRMFFTSATCSMQHPSGGRLSARNRGVRVRREDDCGRDGRVQRRAIVRAESNAHVPGFGGYEGVAEGARLMAICSANLSVHDLDFVAI